jgi:hypothetical protein
MPYGQGHFKAVVGPGWSTILSPTPRVFPFLKRKDLTIWCQYNIYL